MHEPTITPSHTYRVEAPLPSDPDIIPSIYWIEVTCDRAVEWVWTHLPDGNRVVTDYKLIENKDGNVLKTPSLQE